MLNCMKSNSDLPFLYKHTFILKRHYYVIFQSFKENIFALKVSHVLYRMYNNDRYIESFWTEDYAGQIPNRGLWLDYCGYT